MQITLPLAWIMLRNKRVKVHGTPILGIVFGLGLSHSSNVAPLNSSPRERFDAFADYVRNMDHMGNTSKVKGKMPSTESGEMMKSKLKSKAKDAWNNYTENGTLPELPTALPTLPERGHWGSKFGRNETGSGDIGDNETESGGRRESRRKARATTATNIILAGS
eukprot:g72976.t1